MIARELGYKAMILLLMSSVFSIKKLFDLLPCGILYGSTARDLYQNTEVGIWERLLSTHFSVVIVLLNYKTEPAMC